MSTDFHITRAQHWFDGEDSPITLEEWLAYVNSASDLDLDESAGDGYALYTGPTLNNPHPLIYWQSGNLVSTCPDTLLYQKMLRIAKELGARIRDEDDKVYSEQHHWSYDPESQWQRKAPLSAHNSTRRQASSRRPLNRPQARKKILKEIASLTLETNFGNWAETRIEAILDGCNSEFTAWCLDENGEETKFDLSEELREHFTRLRGFAADDETRFWTHCKFQITADGEFKVDFSYD